MKRFLTILLLISCVLPLTYVHANDTSVDVDAYIKVTSRTGFVDLSLCITPYKEMNIGGMEFNIHYNYEYNSQEFPFLFLENSANLVTDELFSDALITSDVPGCISYVSQPLQAAHIHVGETITLASFSLKAEDWVHDGNYNFSLECTEFYYLNTNDDQTNTDIIEANVSVEKEKLTIWYGLHLVTVPKRNEYEVIVSGKQDFLLPIELSKSVELANYYSLNSDIARIQSVDGNYIYVIGKSVGETELVIRGGYNNNEELRLTITVKKESPYFLSVYQQPTKLTYTVGDTLDLSGVELRMEYDNRDVTYVPYSADTASLIEADMTTFSSAGTKSIRISYAGLYAYITVTVTEKETTIRYGDANNDGNIDTKDLVLLRRYLANYNYDTNTSTVAITSGGDANGDGQIDTKDLVLIRRYLANYNYDTGSSGVPLGPQN